MNIKTLIEKYGTDTISLTLTALHEGKDMDKATVYKMAIDLKLALQDWVDYDNPK